MSALFTGKHKEQCECSRVCAINNQGLLWLHTAHRCGNAYTWKALPLASFKRQMEDTGDTFSDLRWNTNCLHKSHEQWQTFQRKLQGTRLLLNTFFLSFFFFFKYFLSIAAFIYSGLPHTGRPAMITRHQTQGAQEKVHSLLGVRTKKGLFVRERHNVL